MKKKLHFKLLLLLCAMVMGIGSAWAEDADVTYDFTGTDWSVSNGALTNGTVSFTGEGSANFKMNSGYFMMGKSGAYINFPIYDSPVAKIVVTGRSGASSSVGQNIFVGDVEVSTPTTGATGENTYEIVSDYQAAGTQYTLKVTSNHNTQITKIEVFFATGGGDTPVPTTYTVTYDCNGGTSGCPENVTDVEAGTAITLADAPTKTDYTFDGWNDGNETYDAGDSYTVNGNVTLTAQWTANGGGITGDGQWVLTDLADLVEGDVFVIVGNNGSTYAMSNNNGASTAPSAVAVTVVNDAIKGDVADNIQWNISGDATNGYTFYPNGVTENWLYCTNTNNGVRVGTNNANTFVISTEGYLYHNGTSRYIGIYNSQDWRCYTSINANITGQSFAFYKYEDGTAPQKADPQLAFSQSEININFGDEFTAPTLSKAEGVGAVEYSSSNEDVAFVTDTETGDLRIVGGGTTVITATFAGDENFKRGSASYTLNVTDNRIATTITQENIVVSLDDVATLTVLTPVVKDADDNVVSYTNSLTAEGLPEVYFEIVSDDNGIFGSFDSHGNVVLNSVTGTATVKAVYNHFQLNANYQPSECTFTVTVNDPNAPGTENNPYTVTEAIAYINTLGTSTSANDVYVSGIISQVDSYSSTYKSITYWISDDGTTTGQMEVYSGKGLDNADFSSKDDLQVGDIVTVKGKVKMYNSTPEFDKNNVLVSFERPASTTPTITVNPASVDVDAAEHDGTLDLTYENLTVTDMSDFDIQFYDATGAPLSEDPDWILVEVAEQDPQVGEGYVVSYVVEENTGDARTAYLKVFALGGNDYVYSNTVTISQAKYVAPDVEVDPAVAGVGAFVKVTSTEGITAGNYLIVYEGNETHDAVAFNGALETLDEANNGIKVDFVDGKIPATTATVAATFTLQPSGSLKSASGLYIGKSANANGLDTDDESALANTFAITDGSAVITAKGGCKLRYNYASDQLRFRYYKNGQQSIQLYKYDADVTIASVDANISAVGYATFCTAVALDFTNTDVTAYKATVTGSEVSFTEVTQVPAGEGVLLKGAAGTHAIPVIESAEAIENDFIGVTRETKVAAGIFVLMNGEKGVGFYKTTKEFTVGAHTAYLPALTDETGTRNFFGFDQTTGINTVNGEGFKVNGYYNLNGQRVDNPQKGLYIVNGKKVMVK